MINFIAGNGYPTWEWAGSLSRFKLHKRNTVSKIFLEGNKASPIPIPPRQKKKRIPIITEKRTKLIKKAGLKDVCEFAEEKDDKTEGKHTDKSKQTRTKSERKSFEKWRANHLLHDEQYWVMSLGKSTNKELKASSLKHVFNASQSAPSLGLSIKNLLIFGNIFSLSAEGVEKLLEGRI